MSLPSNLLVAIDFNPHVDQVLKNAVALAQRLDAKVHLVHAFTLAEVSESDLRSGSYADAVMNRTERLHALAASHLASGCIDEVIVREGDPAAVLVLVAQQVHADLIVVDSYHHGLNRFAHGSVAESLLRDAHCSVWVVHHTDAAHA